MASYVFKLCSQVAELHGFHLLSLARIFFLVIVIVGISCLVNKIKTLKGPIAIMRALQNYHI